MSGSGEIICECGHAFRVHDSDNALCRGGRPWACSCTEFRVKAVKDLERIKATLPAFAREWVEYEKADAMLPKVHPPDTCPDCVSAWAAERPSASCDFHEAEAKRVGEMQNRIIEKMVEFCKKEEAMSEEVKTERPRRLPSEWFKSNDKFHKWWEEYINGDDAEDTIDTVAKDAWHARDTEMAEKDGELLRLKELVESLKQEKFTLRQMLHDIAFFSHVIDNRWSPEYEKGYNEAVSDLTKRAADYYTGQGIGADDFDKLEEQDVLVK